MCAFTAERAEAGWGPLVPSSRLAPEGAAPGPSQYSLLQAANLLTPDMIAEFETLQQLLQEENAEPGGEAFWGAWPSQEGTSGSRAASQSQESQPCSASFCQGGHSLRCMIWWEC